MIHDTPTKEQLQKNFDSTLDAAINEGLCYRSDQGFAPEVESAIADVGEEPTEENINKAKQVFDDSIA
jgi:hypothetical protein